MTKKKAATPAVAPSVGDLVLCDGEVCQVEELVERYSSSTGEPVEAIRYESDTKRHYGLVRDLIHCEQLGMFYLWGRVLSAEQTETVKELRDRGLLKARATRTPGHAPAAGEHHNLYLALFLDVDHELWPAALASIRSGRGVPADAQARINDLHARFTKKLPHGYADRDWTVSGADSYDEPEAK